MDERTCDRCGRRLSGKDRFERLCATCREEAVLSGEGRPAAESAGEPERGGPRRLLWGVGGLLVVLGAGAIAFLVFRSPREEARAPRGESPGEVTAPSAPPAPSQAPPAARPRSPSGASSVPERVAVESQEALRLIAAGQYGRLVDNYVLPDDEDFPRVQGALEEMIGGAGAEGLGHWSRQVIRLGREAVAAQLREAGLAHPGYAVEVLAYLARSPEASGAHVPPQRRARRLFAWHIAGLYEGVDMAGAEIAEMRWAEGGEVVARLALDGEPSAVRPGDAPRRLRWRRLPAGWVLKFALADHLAALGEFLSQWEPAPPAAEGARP